MGMLHAETCYDIGVIQMNEEYEEYEFYDLDNDSTISFHFDIEKNVITETSTIRGNLQPQLDGASITNIYIFREPGAVETIISEFELLDAEFMEIDTFHEVDGVMESYTFDGTLKSDDIKKFSNILKKHAYDCEQIVDV